MFIPDTEYKLYQYLSNRMWRSNNSEYIKKYHTLYNKTEARKIADKKRYEKHKVKIRERSHTHYIKNLDSIKQKGLEYRNSHKDQITEYHIKYNAEHRNEKKEYNKRYREDHPEVIAACEARRDKKQRAAKAKEKADAKKAAGFMYRKDPNTGKHRWIFVGN